MKFISTTTKKDAPFIFEAPLDTSIFKKPTRDGDILSTNFDVGMTVPSLPYFDGTNMVLYVEASGANIYVSAILFVGFNSCNKKLLPYEVDGMVPFNVLLSEEEKLKILLFFISKYFMI